jgi:uncharacterized protein (TIGR02186 family)
MTGACARCAVAALLALVSALPAGAERLVASLSSNVVQITSSFNGVELVLFGTVESDAANEPLRPSYDLVATAIGPRQNLVTRRKERIAGIWVNAESRTFMDVPSYLAVLSTRPFENIADGETLRRQQIGIANTALPRPAGPDAAKASPDDSFRQAFLRIKCEHGLYSETANGVTFLTPSPDAAHASPDDPFRQAFLRIKCEHGLYSETANGVTFLTPTLYRASIFVPAEAQVGSYQVDVKLFADGSVIARADSTFEIVTVGFERFIASSAVDHGILYGFATAAMAVMTGWFASIVFRRD